MKKILFCLSTLLLSFSFTFAATTVPWTRNGTNEYPLYIGDNIGIGTTTPYAKLNVFGDGGAQGPLFSPSSIMSATFPDRYGSIISTVAAPSVAQNAIGQQIDSVSTGGNGLVAVGQLITRVNANFNGGAYGLVVDTVANTTGGQPSIVNGGYFNNITSNSIGNSAGIRLGTVTYSGSSATAAASAIQIDNGTTNTTNSANAYAINSLSTAKSFFAGKVGIGTTSPVTNLDVEGTTALITSIDTGGAMSASRPAWAFGANGGSYTISSTVNNSTYISRLSIDNNGNVGIGTAAPQGSLDVAGNAIIGLRTSGGANNTAMSSVLANVLNAVSPTAVSTTITSPETALRLVRSGTNSNKFNAVVDFSVGSYANTLNSQTQLDIKLDNGGTNNPDVTVMSLLANGSVGIGTSTPNTSLTVQGNSTNGTFMNLANFTTGGRDYWLGGTANGFGIGGGKFVIIDAASNATRLTIDSTGNVGIGSTTPFAKLSVTGAGGSIPNFQTTSSTGVPIITSYDSGNVSIGTSTSFAPLYIDKTSGGAATTALALSNFSGTSGTEVQLRLIPSANLTRYNYISSIQAGASNGNNLDMVFATANANLPVERMRITAAGNVGVGTTSPATKLELQGASASVSGIANPSALTITNTDTTANNLSQIVFSQGLSNGINQPSVVLNSIYTNHTAGSESADFSISTRNAGNSAERLRITAAGNVGVGSTTPWRTLDVNGTVGFKGLTTSAGTQSAVLCLSSQNEVIADSVACIASARRYKQDIDDFSPATSLSQILALQPVTYLYKPDFNGSLQSNPNYSRQQLGLIADDVIKVNPAFGLVETASTTFEGKTYPAGSPASVDYNEVTAALVGAVQAQQKEIENINPNQTLHSVEDTWQDFVLVLFVLYVLITEINKRRI